MDGDIHQRAQLLAHGVQHEGDAAGFGAQQVLVGGVLFGVFFRGQAGAFEEVEHGYRGSLELLAGALGGQPVLSGLLRVPGQIGLAVALHEREVQRPPADADDGHPDQFLLEEELEHRHAPVEVVLQHQNVDPALVVAGDQVPVMLIQPFTALHVPFGASGQAHPAAVAEHPAFGDADHEAGKKTLQGGEWYQQLEQRAGQQQAEPEQGVQDQQQE